MVYPAGNPLPLSPAGVPVAIAPTAYAPAVQLPLAGQAPVAVAPPTAVPPQAWTPDTAQFSQQAVQAASAPQPQARLMPASNPQGYTQLWADAPQTPLWEAAWKNGPSVAVQAPPVIAQPPIVQPPPVYTPPVVQIPVPQPPQPPVVQAPLPQPPAPPAPVTPPPAPVEPPKPDSSSSPIGGLPDVAEPEPAPVYPNPPNETASKLGSLPDVAEPEPAPELDAIPEPEPEVPSRTVSTLGGLPTIEEAKPEPKPQVESKPAPKPEGISGRSWKVVADPHVTTGDGKRFDASLSGRFTLLRSSDGKFEVQNTQGAIPGDRGIWNTALTIKSHGDTVTYDAPSQTLKVNDEKVTFKAGSKHKLSDGGRLEMTNSEYAPGKFAPRVQVVTPEGDRVAFLILQRKNGGRYVDLYGNVGAKRQPGEMSGMVGTFDSDSSAENDLKLRNGKTASSVDDFLKDWKVK
ncbi:hypothetical protein D3C86_985530 [compost metagenome]